MKIASVIASLVITALPAAAGVACPPSSGGRPLARAGSGTLYDGQPSQGFSLAPDSSTGSAGGYSSAWRLRQSAGLTLLCRYEGGGTSMLRLPAGLTSCRQTPTSFVCQ